MEALEQAQLNTTPKLEGPNPQNLEEKSTVTEMQEKVQKPAIGAFLIILLVQNVMMFLVGAITIGKCPVKPNIPIYLLVAGLLGMFTKLAPIANHKKNYVVVHVLVTVIGIVEFIWMILGSVWVYGTNPSYDEGNPNYCNKTAYLFAFWLLTLYYVSVLLIITCTCCVVCCMVCFADKS